MDAAATSIAATHARPRHTLKRTRSTASVNERVMDMLNPRHQQEMQYAPDSDDEDLAAPSGARPPPAGMGMQEDWEVEQHDDGSSSDEGVQEQDIDGDDPFSDAPAVRKRVASASDMVLDSPTNSPTRRRTSNGYGKPATRAPSASPTKRKTTSDQSVAMLSDDEDNPFTVKPGKRAAASPPAAPRKQAPKGSDRVSYVL